MRHTKSVLPIDQIDTVVRMQAVVEPEIQTYISSLKQTYAKYRLSLEAGRKLIDDSMKTASLTAVLYEAREH